MFCTNIRCYQKKWTRKKGEGDLEIVTSKCFVLIYDATRRNELGKRGREIFKLSHQNVFYQYTMLPEEMKGGRGSWNCHFKMFCAITNVLCYQKKCDSKNGLGKGCGGGDLEMFTLKCFVQINPCVLLIVAIYQKICESNNGLVKWQILKFSHQNVLQGHLGLLFDVTRNYMILKMGWRRDRSFEIFNIRMFQRWKVYSDQQNKIFWKKNLLKAICRKWSYTGTGVSTFFLISENFFISHVLYSTFVLASWFYAKAIGMNWMTFYAFPRKIILEALIINLQLFYIYIPDNI